MAEEDDAVRRIAKARFLARQKWLREHPEASSTYTHAHAAIGQLEAGIAEGLTPEDMTAKEYLVEMERILRERHNVDISRLPE